MSNNKLSAFCINDLSPCQTTVLSFHCAITMANKINNKLSSVFSTTMPKTAPVICFLHHHVKQQTAISFLHLFSASSCQRTNCHQFSPSQCQTTSISFLHHHVKQQTTISFLHHRVKQQTAISFLCTPSCPTTNCH